jgi:hypothetical protein
MSAIGDLQAIFGSNPYGARSWPMSFSGTSAVTAAKVVPGGYSLCPSQDCWVKLASSSGTVAVPGTSTTQPAINDVMFCPANQITPLTVPNTGGGSFLHVIRDSADGTLRISGPLAVQP